MMAITMTMIKVFTMMQNISILYIKGIVQRERLMTHFTLIEVQKNEDWDPKYHVWPYVGKWSTVF